MLNGCYVSGVLMAVKTQQSCRYFRLANEHNAYASVMPVVNELTSVCLSVICRL